MKFTTIEDSVQNLEIVCRTMNQLFIELGVRDNNEHVGTGMGGNNFQLLCLLSVKHTLCYQRKPMVLIGNTIRWDALWLMAAPMKLIREELNEFFSSLNEEYKYQGLIYLSLPHSESLHANTTKYLNHFPKLESNFEQLTQAYTICSQLAKQLDDGDASQVQTVAAALLNYEPEVILMSVRIYIQIDRLVRHYLDEDPAFSQCLNKVQSLLD